jgi:hypothetical protein
MTKKLQTKILFVQTPTFAFMTNKQVKQSYLYKVSSQRTHFNSTYNIHHVQQTATNGISRMKLKLMKREDFCFKNPLITPSTTVCSKHALSCNKKIILHAKIQDREIFRSTFSRVCIPKCECTIINWCCTCTWMSRVSIRADTHIRVTPQASDRIFQTNVFFTTLSLMTTNN